ncbi:MAG: RNA polymerase sigma factor [Labilithrix sp.]|nr:RNA polymerase sigma factor [Labilithrix sp.]MCW5831593.1 RNA polymerase sigma factor [Labilithrix sp.]
MIDPQTGGNERSGETSADPSMSANVSRVLPLVGVADVTREERLRRSVDEHYLFVWRSLRRLGVPESEADDVAQETFLVFSRKLDGVDASAERGFLFRAATYAAMHAQRKYRRQRTLEESAAILDGDGEHPSVEEDAERQETLVLLDSLLAKLSDDLRVVVILCDLEEMTMNEAAEILSVPVGTVASRLRRARAGLSAGMTRITRSMR